MLVPQEIVSYHGLAVFGIAAFVLYNVGWCIYQLYFSPLAKFPGPKIAAVTRMYEAYHDFYRWGQYTFVIEEMHKKYGTYELSPSLIGF